MPEKIPILDRNSAGKRSGFHKTKGTISSCPLKKTYHQKISNSNNYSVTAYWLKYQKLLQCDNLVANCHLNFRKVIITFQHQLIGTDEL